MRASADRTLLISGADSRLSHPACPGPLSFKQGVWIGLSRQYVLDHYAVHDTNALLSLLFDPKDILEGSLDDKDPELCVKRALITRIDFF